MEFSRAFVVTIVLFALCLSCQATNVSYDGRALLIDGERRIILSGSIHYPRSTPDMWPSLIRDAKEGGLNAIETYVFWNAHEPRRRKYDFSGNLDLVRFMRTVQDAGLYAILRIGPYVCAEWNYGGFPVWLHNMPNMTFRTKNQPFMDEMSTFTTLIVNMIKRANLFASQGGPIILAQIENEYGDLVSGFGNEARPYIEWCAQFAESLNIGVPWIMCQQGDAPDPMINTCNGFYCDGFKPKNNKIPKMWTENWTGWFKDWGSPDRHRPAEDVAFSVARFFQFQGTLQNYYMYHGGTNFGRHAGGPYITTSYDYDAPLDEYGLLNQPKWGHLKQLHFVLKSIEKILTHGDYLYKEYGDYKFSSSVYSYNGVRICFFGNADYSRDFNINFEGRQYTVPAWSVLILLDCKTVIYNTARINAQTNVLEKVDNIGGLKWHWRTEPFEHLSEKHHHHHHHEKGVTVASELLDQKTVTDDTTDYLWYMTTVKMDKKDPVWGREVTLSIHTKGHVVHAFVNGNHIGSKAAANGQYEFDFTPIARLKHGINTISLLSGTVGLQNYGAYYEKISNGILGPVKLIAPNNEEKDLSNNEWTYKVGLSGMEKKKIYLDNDNNHWHSSQKSLPINRMFTWFKTTFDTPSGQEPVVLNLQDMGKGTAWVNGNNIGRYWVSNFADRNDGCDYCDYRAPYDKRKCSTGCGNSTQQWYHIPRSFLRDEGNNNLVLFEEFGGDPRKIKLQTVNLLKICANAEEGNVLDLSCQGRVMKHINFASFGNPTGVCGAFAKGTCESSNSLSVINDLCIGKRDCSVDLSSKIFKCTPECESEKRRLAVEIVCA